MAKRWNEEKIEDLCDNYIYYVNHKKEAINLFDCSWVTIRKKASILGLTGYIMKRWSEEEIEDLCENYEYYRHNKDIACSNFNRTWWGIEAKALASGFQFGRNRSEYSILRSPLVDLFSGLLLSDGYISVYNNTGYYSQTCTELNWLEYIKTFFDVYGVKSSISYVKRDYNKHSGWSIQYQLVTLSYVEFKTLHDKWYKEWYDDPDDETNIKYKKMIPKDLVLTSLCVANLYYGDGSLSQRKSGFYSKERPGGYNIIFATNCFSKNEVRFLQGKLNEAIFISTYIDSENRLCIGQKESVSKFFDYIKEHKGNFYNYKWIINEVN